jgi:protein-L-isoaspartate(D-aspartate) O-methyltransferase
VTGDGSDGWPDAAPFDAIVVGAAAPVVPEPLLGQLTVGGRIVIPIGPRDHQVLTVIERQGDTAREWRLDPCMFVPLVGRHGFQAA